MGLLCIDVDTVKYLTESCFCSVEYEHWMIFRAEGDVESKKIELEEKNRREERARAMRESETETTTSHISVISPNA